MPNILSARLANPCAAATAASALLLCCTALPAAAATLSVGPGKTYALPCQAFARAVAGDVVEITGGATYSGDVCAIAANNLTIRGVNGRPRIDAAGKNAYGKATWVVVGSNMTIDNVEMLGAKVPDRNGAALRVEGAHLTLRNSHLHSNENGILTNENLGSNIVIENTEFGFNGYGDGYSHNVYIGRINSLVFRGNYSHDANVGHNLKSRANTNVIAYSRFSSTTGQPSYEIDLPNAGSSYLIGNVIQQPAANQNPGLVSYGMEGASNTGKDLYVVNNTFLNDRSAGGTFLQISSAVTVPVLAQNNLFVGTGTFSSQGSTIDRNNLKVASYAFVDRAKDDLRPAAGTQAVDNGIAPAASPAGVSLTATLEYTSGAQTRARAVVGTIDIGAYESASAAPTPPAGDDTPITNPWGAEVWSPCAQENGVCAVPGQRRVRYGANGKYFFKTATNQVTCNNATFGDPVYGIAKSCAFDATVAAAPTWSFCAAEKGNCAVTGTRQVRYGADGRYAYKTITGSVKCDNATFGDPFYGRVKTCEASSG